jgi:hypothetical protein
LERLYPFIGDVNNQMHMRKKGCMECGCQDIISPFFANWGLNVRNSGRVSEVNIQKQKLSFENLDEVKTV